MTKDDAVKLMEQFEADVIEEHVQAEKFRPAWPASQRVVDVRKRLVDALVECDALRAEVEKLKKEITRASDIIGQLRTDAVYLRGEALDARAEAKHFEESFLSAAAGAANAESERVNLRAEVVRLRMEPSRGTDHPLGGVVEDAPAQRGETAKPAPFDAAKAPVGTVVHFKDSASVCKMMPEWWRELSRGCQYVHSTQVTANVAARVSAGEAVDVWIPPVGATPAPAERQPCAGWQLDDDSGDLFLPGGIAGVQRRERDVYSAYVRGTFFESHPTLVAAQLAAEDALDADAREVLRLLGKGGA